MNNQPKPIHLHPEATQEVSRLQSTMGGTAYPTTAAAIPHPNGLAGQVAVFLPNSGMTLWEYAAAHAPITEALVEAAKAAAHEKAGIPDDVSTLAIEDPKVYGYFLQYLSGFASDWADSIVTRARQKAQGLAKQGKAE